ncbi:MAG: MFS transporter [Pseudomonadota bacterium]
MATLEADASASPSSGYVLPQSTRMLYGFSDLGVNILVVSSVLITFAYLTTVIGVQPGIAGAMLMLAKIWDVITDPLIGRWSDATSSRMGRRRPWIMWGALLMAIGFAAMFAAPFEGSSPNMQGAYFVLAMMFTFTAFTMVGVPYGAMTPEMTPDYHERSNLTAWRMGFGSIGLLIGGAGAPLLIGAFGGGIEGHRMMGLALIPVIALPPLLTVWGTRNVKSINENPQPPVSFSEQLKIVRQNKPFMLLAGLYLLQVGMIAQITSGLILACAYIFKADDPNALLTVLYGLFVLSTIAAMPLWLWIGQRLSKKQAYIAGGILFIIGTCSIALMNENTMPVAYGLMVLIGIGYAAYQIFPWSMLADTISHAQTYTDQPVEGLFNGYWTAFQKTGIAIGPFVIGLVLQAAGYVPSTDGSFPAQTETAVTALRYCISVVPALVFGITLFGVARYPLK